MQIVKAWLRKHAVRHAIGVGVAVATTLLLSKHFGFYSPGWMVLTALLVSQTTRGTPLRQGIIYFFLIIVCVTLIVLFDSALMSWLYDVLIGGIVGILCGQFIFPVRTHREFSQGMLPIIHAIMAFNTELGNVLLGGNGYVSLHLALQEVEKSLQTQYGMYPEWVYEVGFNPGLRAGYRFFLVNIERITEIIFSLDYRLRLLRDTESLHGFATELLQVIQHNNTLLQQLVKYFSEEDFVESENDFTTDMIALENKAKQFIPTKLDILTVYPDSITLVILIRDVKDMRHLLLQLLLAVTKRGPA